MNYEQARAALSGRLVFGDPSAVAAKRLVDKIAGLEEDLARVRREGDRWDGERHWIIAEIKTLKVDGLSDQDRALGNY